MEDSSTGETLASLLRRSHIHSSLDLDERYLSRNSEDVHTEALALSRAEHDRIRDTARRALELNEAREQNEKLRRQAAQEEERVRIETEHAKEQCRLRDIENKAKQIPVPAPRLPTPPPVPTQPPTPPVQKPTPPAQIPDEPHPKETGPTPHQLAPPSTTTLSSSSTAAPATPSQLQGTPSRPPASAALFKNSASDNTVAPNPFQNSQNTNTRPPSIPTPQVAPVSQTSQPVKSTDNASNNISNTERYVEIHKDLKKLRKWIVAEGAKDITLKKRVGDLAREIRKNVGQLTVGKGVNKVQTQNIVRILEGTFGGGPQIDPSAFVVSVPPKGPDGTPNNETLLPALFLFLLNVLSRQVVKQFVLEAGVRPQTADPVGMLVASIFSRPQFSWRGKPLIDILMAKMRVVCPVVFGIQASDKGEKGRARLCWRKRDGEWIEEQEHVQRMTGLAAGYAAISLRDFSNVSFSNPWPPFHYWQAMASIVSTPTEVLSSTQYIVLKALIEYQEGRFFQFYGSAARAALRIALVDFPARSPDANPATKALTVLADKLERDDRLMLR